MNRSLTQLNATLCSNYINNFILKSALLLFFFFCLMLNTNNTLAQTNQCPEGDPLQLQWMQDLITSSNGNDIATIHQFQYEGETYFNTLNANAQEEIYSLYYNCAGEQVCEYIHERYDDDRCFFDLYVASFDFTTLWTYATPVPTENCPADAPLQWTWIQNLIATNNKCGAGIIKQLEYNGNTYFSAGEGQNCELKETPTYYYNCVGDVICVEDRFGIPCDQGFRAAINNSITIWTYEPPALNCPAGDPLQWTWMQDLIASSSGCNLGAIHQFEYAGNTYYRTADKETLCFPSNHTYKFYNCLGEEVCTDPVTGASPGRETRCKEEVLAASADFTVIWTYEDPFPNQACPPGEPLEWAWIQDLIAEGDGCDIGTIAQFDYEGKMYFMVRDGQFCGSVDYSILLYDCKGQRVCSLSQAGSACEEDFIRAGWGGTPIWIYEPTLAENCPEGDPSQWYWVQDIIDNRNNNGYRCIGSEIRYFEYDNQYIVQLVHGECIGISGSSYLDCKNNVICWENEGDNAPGVQCEQIIAASNTNNYTTLWAYEAPEPTITCPTGDPLQWNWMKNLLNNNNYCSVGEIHQFNYEGDTYFVTAAGRFDGYPCPAGISSKVYDCQGNFLCEFEAGVNPNTLCEPAIIELANEFNLIWLNGPEPTSPCPEGNPLQWDWIQELIASSDGYLIARIHQFEYEGETYFYTINSNIFTETTRYYYNCAGESVCELTQTGLLEDQCDEDMASAGSTYTTLWVFGEEPASMNQIKCPENHTTSICAPVTMPPSLTMQDFSTSSNPNYMNSMSMQMHEQTEIQQYFNTTTRTYTISDESGNQKTCETKHHIANQFLQMPEVSQPGVICEEDLWSYVKIGTHQYMLYTDQNGSIGTLMSTCNSSSLACSTASLGVDTKVPGQYHFWASSYFEFPDGTICESEAMPFYVDVQAKPVAELITSRKVIQAGDGMALMDLVSENKSGYWSGENIIYLMSATGENIAYFSANETGVYKLYYKVKNEFCERSDLLIVEVKGISKNSLKTLNRCYSLTYNVN